MSDIRTPDEIERELEQNREGLQTTLRELQNTFTPDAIFRSITDNVGTHGGEWGRSATLAARENPLALAVTGIGLGWLIFGHGPSADRIEANARRARSQDTDDDGLTGRARSAGYGDDADDASIGTRGPVPAGEGPNWFGEDHGPTTGQRMRAGMHNARRDASDRVGRVRDRSAEMNRRLSEGTSEMSEAARERIIAAREQAILAREQAERGLSRGTDRAVDFFEEHPLVAGALAFAVGAAIAGSMPRSRYEDEHFGAESDRLRDEAERVYHEERAKAERVAGAALDEAKTVGEEVRRDADKAARDMKDRADSETRGQGSAADAAVDRTEDAVRRVTDAAEEQAEKEDMGPSRS